MKKMQKYGNVHNRLSGLYVHLLLFFVVNFGLFLLNFLAYPLTVWFYFPLLIWAVAVMIHSFMVLIEHDEVWNEKSILEAIRKGML
jgi:hypothetical protein